MNRSVAAAALAASALLALTACAPQASSTATSKPSATSRAAVSPTPTVTPTPSVPALPADVLFQITAVATAPTGATAKLTETVHAPVTATMSQASDETLLDSQCDSWRNAFPTIKYLVADVVTKVTTGTWGPDQIVAVDMAGYPVWTGDQRPFQAFCASALPSIPGSARAVSPVGGGPSDSQGGWGVYRYGFAVPTDPSLPETPSPTDVVLSKCSIQLGVAGTSSVFASSWPDSPETTNGLSCFFGGS